MKFKLWYYKSTDNKFYKEGEIVRACSSINNGCLSNSVDKKV